MKTLEQYLRDAPVIDHVIRSGTGPDGSVSFYIHPQGADGETLDFGVCGNSMALIRNGEETRFDFGVALAVLKSGGKVARAGWNGKGMWLSLSCDGTREVAADNFWSPHNAEFARQNGGTAKVLPSITMKTVDSTGREAILMGWLASQTDMLSEDWMVVAE